MAICKYCGEEVKDGQKFCTYCGAELESIREEPAVEAASSQVQEPKPVQNPTPAYNQSQNTQPAVVDNGGFGWGLLGCCIPLVGLILFLVWKDTKPNTAKAAGIGALVSVILSVVFSVLSTVLGIGAGLMGM